LDYEIWFIKTLVLLNNTVGIYVDPVSWRAMARPAVSPSSAAKFT
jgi:hypothetical protein